MAPAKKNEPPYAKDERVLCFHHELLYEAKVIDVRESEEGWECKIHYKGWKATWDDWVPVERVRKFNSENQELAKQLHDAVKNMAQSNKATKEKSTKGKKVNGSDLSSARGSEERGGAAATSGRGPRGRRDYDLESSQQTKADKGST